MRPTIRRDRISRRKPAIKEFLKSTVLTPSGRDKNYYFGTPRSMFQSYKQYCVNNKKKYLAFKVFHRIRKQENVGIIQGDQYTDDMWIKLKYYQNEYERIDTLESTDLPERDRQMWLDQINEVLNPLIQHDTNANWQIAQYKQDMLNLRTNFNQLIIILDFTKWNQAAEGNVQDLIVVLASGWSGPLEEGQPFKPHLQYIDFTAECRKKFKGKKEVKVKQSFAYVKTALLELHNRKYLDNYASIIIWSDGGPSHFKVYKTHSWMPKFARITGKSIEWNNFYPNRGHNIADSHAGHAKRQVRKQEHVGELTKSVDQVESGISKLSNTTIIRLEATKINENDIQDRKPKGEPWVKKFFHFKYQLDGSIMCKALKHGPGDYQLKRTSIVKPKTLPQSQGRLAVITTKKSTESAPVFVTTPIPVLLPLPKPSPVIKYVLPQTAQHIPLLRTDFIKKRTRTPTKKFKLLDSN